MTLPFPSPRRPQKEDFRLGYFKRRAILKTASKSSRCSDFYLFSPSQRPCKPPPVENELRLSSFSFPSSCNAHHASILARTDFPRHRRFPLPPERCLRPLLSVFFLFFPTCSSLNFNLLLSPRRLPFRSSSSSETSTSKATRSVQRLRHL